MGQLRFSFASGAVPILYGLPLLKLGSAASPSSRCEFSINAAHSMGRAWHPTVVQYESKTGSGTESAEEAKPVASGEGASKTDDASEPKKGTKSDPPKE